MQASNKLTKLLAAVTDNVNSAAVSISGNHRDNYVLIADGAWDSGTVAVEASADGMDFVALLDPTGDAVALTADGAYPFTAQGLELRLALTGVAGAAANLNAWIAH